jgi:uncharacterized protein (DUF433 family)
MTLVIGEKELSQLPVTIDPAVLSGAPVFRGARVPVDARLSAHVVSVRSLLR